MLLVAAKSGLAVSSLSCGRGTPSDLIEQSPSEWSELTEGVVELTELGRADSFSGLSFPPSGDVCAPALSSCAGFLVLFSLREFFDSADSTQIVALLVCCVGLERFDKEANAEPLCCILSADAGVRDFVLPLSSSGEMDIAFCKNRIMCHSIGRCAKHCTKLGL